MNDYLYTTMYQNVFFVLILNPKSRSNQILINFKEDKMNTPHSQMSHSCEGKNYLILYLCSWDKVQHNPLTQQGQTRPKIEEDRLILLDQLSTSLCWLDGGSPSVSGCCFLMHLEHNLHYVSCCHFQTDCCQPPSATPGNTNREIRLVCCLPVVHCILCVFVI